jgi:ATP-dependent Lon protease
MSDDPEEIDEIPSDPSEESIQPQSSMPRGGLEIRVGSREGGEEEEGPVELPDELPVLPLKNTVLFPFLLSPLLVNTPTSQQVARVRIGEFVAEDPFLRARIAQMDDLGDLDTVEVEALTRNLSSQFGNLVAESSRLSDELQVLVANLDDPSKLADLVASNLELEVAAKQQVLEQEDVPDRLRLVLGHLTKEGQALEIETEIKEKVQTEMGKTQREYMLRQQLEAIRRELGESEDGEEGVERLRERIEQAGMPEEAQKQAQRELDRLAQTPPAAAEHSVIRTYLEWMGDLPWSEISDDRLDVAEARRILDEDHYGLEKVKDRIVEYIAVLSLKRDLKGPILCFVGPPGTGKTSLGRSIARALDRQFARISLGGVRDEAEIRGHRRTYVGAMPGRIIQSLKKTGTRNPVMLLDEVDKVGSDGRGDPSSALLEVLDPEQNHEFSDHYLEVPFDLSQVLFIATANMIDPVHAALRDRMEVIELPGYTLEEKVEIARRFLLARQTEQNGIGEIDFEMPDETLTALIERYTREAGVRNLEREIGAVCRKIARQVAEGTQSGPVSISADDLFDLLGPVKFEPELAEQDHQPGVAVGLAWTPAGGDILFVEATRMPGQGALKLTGSLGDVMRESVEAARSWLRSHAEEFGLRPEVDFDQRDLHVHVPSGGVPKDGPSAGVAMVTSLASLMTGRPSTPNVAMTGEITLRGKVLPVGGIKEKVLAAKRAGIERVILPEQNRRDVEEIPSELLAGLELGYVGTIDDALQYTLCDSPSPSSTVAA